MLLSEPFFDQKRALNDAYIVWDAVLLPSVDFDDDDDSEIDAAAC